MQHRLGRNGIENGGEFIARAIFTVSGVSDNADRHLAAGLGFWKSLKRHLGPHTKTFMSDAIGILFSGYKAIQRKGMVIGRLFFPKKSAVFALKPVLN